MSKAWHKGDSVVTGRLGGRPRKNDPPRVPYDEVDRLLVFGEAMPIENSAGTTLVYPSYRDLALRFGVSNSVIANYSKKHCCLKRRAVAEARLAAKVENHIVEMRAEAIALSKVDEIRIADSYLAGFEKAMAEGKVRFDDVGQFDRLCRLKEFLLGGADSRHEVHAGLTLEDLQERHKRMLRVSQSTSPEERGEVPRALPGAPPTARLAMPTEEASGRFRQADDAVSADHADEWE